jgi:hypothetical protein
MTTKKQSEPTPQDYLQQMEDDRRHLSTEEWLDFLTDLRDELAIRIRMTENDLKRHE